MCVYTHIIFLREVGEENAKALLLVQSFTWTAAARAAARAPSDIGQRFGFAEAAAARCDVRLLETSEKHMFFFSVDNADSAGGESEVGRAGWEDPTDAILRGYTGGMFGRRCWGVGL